jgi:hypothetical protein
MEEQILMDNHSMNIQARNGTFFQAAATCVRHARGDCTFVITAADDATMKQLVNNRADIAALARRFWSIPKRNELKYIERDPAGNCRRINLNNLGRGPGTLGEPEHAKPVETPVSQEVVREKLGSARLPVARAMTLPRLAGSERAEVQREVKEQRQATERRQAVPKRMKPRF